MARYGHSPHSSMKHLNGNLLCAIDVETTGFDAQKHDIIQLCILPLDHQIKPLETIMPFFVEMTPKRPENVDLEASKVHRLKMCEIIKRGMDPDKAYDLFEEWFAALNLPIGKNITPLAHNWVFDREFVREWTGGPLNFQNYFDFRYRDSMVAASFMNDRADARCAKYPYPKVSLEYLCSIHQIKNPKAHDALADCITTAEIYRRMLIEVESII